SSFTIETLAGRREATVRYAEDGTCAVTVGMGLPQFEPDSIPVRISAPRVLDYPLDVEGETFIVAGLSTRTAQTVVFVDALPDDELFLRISPRIENHPLFPERTSVMWTRCRSDTRIELRIWERSVGETWGCGTGACAAAVAARLHGWAQDTVTVASK